MIEVRKTKSMGRGLFATKKIEVGELIHTADFILVKDAEVNLCPTIARYAFQYDDGYSAICLGLGSLFNHSSKPNAEAYFDVVDEREVMTFVSLEEIECGKQIFIFYGGEEYAFSRFLK